LTEFNERSCTIFLVKCAPMSKILLAFTVNFFLAFKIYCDKTESTNETGLIRPTAPLGRNFWFAAIKVHASKFRWRRRLKFDRNAGFLTIIDETSFSLRLHPRDHLLGPICLPCHFPKVVSNLTLKLKFLIYLVLEAKLTFAPFDFDFSHFNCYLNEGF